MIGFIGTSVAICLNYNQYSAITDLHTFQFTVAHTLGFSVSTSRLLATVSTQERSLQITMKSFLIQFFNANYLSHIHCMTGISWSKFSTQLNLALYSDLATSGLVLYSHRMDQCTEHTASSIVAWCLCWGYHVIAIQPVNWCAVPSNEL
jgi:hypothetical protein